MACDRFHLGAGVPCAMHEDIKVCHLSLPNFLNSRLDRERVSLWMAGFSHRHRRFTPAGQQELALPPERGRRGAEMFPALADEVGRIGQADAQPDAADADMIEPGLAQHPARLPAMRQSLRMPLKVRLALLRQRCKRAFRDAQLPRRYRPAVNPGSA